MDNEILNQNKKKLKKIYEINQFLEMKLFVELQKPSLLKRNKIKYLFST